MRRSHGALLVVVLLAAPEAHADEPARPARAIAPLSGSRIAGRLPRFVVDQRAGGATVEICRERTCAQPIMQLPVANGFASPSRPLEPGLVYWRVRGARGAPSPVWSLWIGRGAAKRCAVAGFFTDLDGDGHADSAVGRAIVLGSARGLAAAAVVLDERDVETIITVPDLNGDGFADVVAAAPRAGKLYVHFGGAHGPSGTPSQTIVSPVKTRTFGSALAGVGDVDGDGYGDLIVGAPGALSVYLFSGGSAGLAAAPSATWTRPSRHEHSSFGQALDAIGDADGDDFDDFVALASGNNELTLFHGGATPPQAPYWTAFGGGDTQWAATVQAAGDVDGDGLADIIHSYVIDAEGKFDARLVAGGSPAMRPLGKPLTVPGDSGFLLVGRAGDVDGDGFDDVFVGELRGTKLYIFSGSASGAGRPRALTLPQGLVDARGVGDVDGDGFEDLLVVIGKDKQLERRLYLGGAAGLRLLP
jgi:hypothetical protein